ncbi:MAG: Hsp20/alpha crystallin family protein [Acidobacteria bacterium]|nr:Hsp20/alpha crystallin family protein [Acidobacteriota bacterium]
MIRWEPLRELATMRDRMNRLFDPYPRGWCDDEGLATSLWNPPVDVYETNESIVIKADLPEVAPNDVDIAVQGNTLTVRGERKRESEINEKDYHRVERSYGTFARSFTLPATIDADKIEANFSQGVLKINLPKREESKPKQVKVKVSSNGK